MNATRPRKITLIFLKIFFNVKLNVFEMRFFFSPLFLSFVFYRVENERNCIYKK